MLQGCPDELHRLGIGPSESLVHLGIRQFVGFAVAVFVVDHWLALPSQVADGLVVSDARDPRLERRPLGVILPDVGEDLDEDILIHLFGILNARHQSCHLCKDVAAVAVEHCSLCFGFLLAQSLYQVYVCFGHD